MFLEPFRLEQQRGHVLARVRLSPDDEDCEHEHGVEEHQPPAAADRVVEEVDDEGPELKKKLY